MLLEKGAKAEVSEIFERNGLIPKAHFTTWDDYAIMSWWKRTRNQHTASADTKTSAVQNNCQRTGCAGLSKYWNCFEKQKDHIIGGREISGLSAIQITAKHI
jgi:hypothetical protein